MMTGLTNGLNASRYTGIKMGTLLVVIALVVWIFALLLCTTAEPKLSKPQYKAKTSDFLKFAFPLIRKAWPQLIVDNIISVQPMSSPVSLVFYNQYRSSWKMSENEWPGEIKVGPFETNMEEWAVVLMPDGSRKVISKPLSVGRRLVRNRTLDDPELNLLMQNMMQNMVKCMEDK